MVDDVQEIKNLIYSYAELLDSGDIDSAAGLFAQASVRIPGGEQKLRAAEVRALLEPVPFYDGVPATKHVITNVVVEVAEDRHTATARSYYTAFQARPELPLQPILAGRFHDRFEREAGRWRFSEREIHADLFGDLRLHIRGVAD